MADLEQERVTALWREAAAALDQPQVRDEWPAFTENFYRDPTTRQWVYRWSDARIVVAGEDCAGCGRLREQLDAARQGLQHYADQDNWALDPFSNDVSNTAGYVLWHYDGRDEEPWTAARAALGVVGEADDE